MPPPFVRTVGAVDYAFPWDGLIARLKFRDGLDLAPSFARLLADAVRRADAMPPSLLLPLPLGPERLRERGYNQAWEIARRLGLPADARLLMRRVDSPHQSSLPRSRRAANVRGCFAVEPRQAARLRGQRIALVDDVMTTGASASEAARTLLEAGAASVQVWVFARTPAPGDEA